MNVVFNKKAELVDVFVRSANEHGIYGLSHKGRVRASIYNATKVVDVSYLINFMRDFMNINDVSVITLDGPSGSGKSTIAYQVSLKLGYLFGQWCYI